MKISPRLRCASSWRRIKRNSSNVNSPYIWRGRIKVGRKSPVMAGDVTQEPSTKWSLFGSRSCRCTLCTRAKTSSSITVDDCLIRCTSFICAQALRTSKTTAPTNHTRPKNDKIDWDRNSVGDMWTPDFCKIGSGLAERGDSPRRESPEISLEINIL